MHGNCVFPDDEIVKVKHQSGRSVVGSRERQEDKGHLTQKRQEGKVHFPLGLMWDAGTAMLGTQDLKPGAWLRVDCGPVTQNAEKSSSDTQIVKAEVFVGCALAWSKDFSTEPDPPKTTSFKELITPIDLDVEEEGPRALEVTLTLKFGGNDIEFYSLAIYGFRRLPPGHCVSVPTREGV